MPILSGIEQDTGAWVQARVGSATASRASAWMAKRKDMKEAAPRHDYKMELVIERLTGRAIEHYVTREMEWGIETQPLASAAYEMDQEIFVVPGGFWRHTEVPWFAASPDYLVGDCGLVEIKCPMTDTHLETLLAREIPDEYIWQMSAQLSCTGRKWCDFVSFDPRLPDKSQYFVKRFERDEKLVAAVEIEVRQFLREVEAMVEQLAG